MIIKNVLQMTPTTERPPHVAQLQFCAEGKKPLKKDAHPIYEGVTTIGRVATASCMLEYDWISSSHASITWNPCSAFGMLKDTGSRNGTFLECPSECPTKKKKKLIPGKVYVLQDGSVITFGNIKVKWVEAPCAADGGAVADIDIGKVVATPSGDDGSPCYFPTDTIGVILELLPLESRCRVMSVSRAWQGAANATPSAWRICRSESKHMGNAELSAIIRRAAGSLEVLGVHSEHITLQNPHRWSPLADLKANPLEHLDFSGCTRLTARSLSKLLAWSVTDQPVRGHLKGQSDPL